MEYEIIRLDNGIRAVFHRQLSPITHTCLVVNAGSRDEDEGKYGVAHFIEHLLFKQTERRSTQQILNYLEAVGRSEEHTSELQSRENLVCRLLLEKKKNKMNFADFFHNIY